MRFSLLFLAAAALPALDVGAQAPPLTSVTWIKGGPVTIGAHITVVERWATWCAPCRESIPHLTKLAAHDGDQVAIAGLSDEDADEVTPFVTAQGPNMAYHVGVIDEATRLGYSEIPGSVYDGIPFAYLVDTKGVVRWKGRPHDLDRPLKALVNGTFDPGFEARRETLQAEFEALLRQDFGADKEGMVAKLSRKISELLAVDPTHAKALHYNNLIAHDRDDPSLIRTTIAALPLAQIDGESAANIALSLINDELIAFRFPDLALQFAEHAVAAEPQAAAGYAARATVLQALGLPDEALADQERAARIAPTEQSLMLTYLRELKRMRLLVQHPTPSPATTQPVP